MGQPQPAKPLVARHEELWNAVAAGETTRSLAAITLVAEGYTLTTPIAEEVMRHTPLELKRGYLRGPAGHDATLGR